MEGVATYAFLALIVALELLQLWLSHGRHVMHGQRIDGLDHRVTTIERRIDGGDLRTAEVRALQRMLEEWSRKQGREISEHLEAQDGKLQEIQSVVQGIASAIAGRPVKA